MRKKLEFFIFEWRRRTECNTWYAHVVPHIEAMQLYSVVFSYSGARGLDALEESGKNDMRTKLIALRDELNGMDLDESDKNL